MRRLRHLLPLVSALLAWVLPLRADEAPGIVFACQPENDLFQAATSPDGSQLPRFDSPAQAIANAPAKAGVLLLADGYPTTPLELEEGLLAAAAKKYLRLYVEFPAGLPGQQPGPVRRAQWERTVVSSDAFGPALKQGRILMIQDCHFVPLQAPAAQLTLARVAGFDEAVFGLPKQDTWPILFEAPGGGVLVATTKLSQFVTGRYAPTDAWSDVWSYIFKWLAGDRNGIKLTWAPTVQPSYSRAEPLGPAAQLEAVRRGVAWYSEARLLVHPAWAAKLDAMPQEIERVEPGPTAAMPVGDGSLGILEAFSSAIRSDGSQPVRWYVRADCASEAAFALAMHGVLDGDSNSLKIAAKLVDFVDFHSVIQQGPRADPQSPSFGLRGWDTRPMGATVYYGDDNARSVLAQLGVAGALHDDRWDESLLQCILANFRTTGPAGFRNARIEEPELQAKGWRWFWDESDGGWGGYRECPHYQAYQWAVNLWLYDKTKFAPLLDLTRDAIRHQMRVYPGGWQAESAREEGERCRMLLPLAWLVRVQDTPEHRQWLDTVASYVLGVQDRSGAIAQRVTRTAARNEDYGTGECALIHANGDPATDLLYGGNFALLGLHEAAAATGSAELKAAADRLAEFLIRVQVRSSQRGELDGVWFRGFDFKRWDYWGSNGDVGWGVWATETGWTQGWIAGVLALRERKTTLWELTAGSRIARHMAKLRPQMLPDDALLARHTTISHEAVGAVPTLKLAPATAYAAAGPATLCDGKLAMPQRLQEEWLGWQGDDLTAVIDLGSSRSIRRLGARFLQQIAAGVFLPASVEFAVSATGVEFTVVATVKPAPPTPDAKRLVRMIDADAQGVAARYVRITARNLGVIPPWQGSAPGAPAWLFCDEIVVNPKDR